MNAVLKINIINLSFESQEKQDNYKNFGLWGAKRFDVKLFFN